MTSNVPQPRDIVGVAREFVAMKNEHDRFVFESVEVRLHAVALNDQAHAIRVKMEELRKSAGVQSDRIIDIGDYYVLVGPGDWRVISK